MKTIIVLIVGLCTISCHKHDADSDTTAPALTILTPTEGSVFSNGQQVSITGTVTDESLHELLIAITKDADGSIVYKPISSPEVHDLTSYTINEKWTPSGIPSAMPATLTISAEDHNGNKTVKSIKLKINP